MLSTCRAFCDWGSGGMKGLFTSLMSSGYCTKLHSSVLFPQSLPAHPGHGEGKELPSVVKTVLTPEAMFMFPTSGMVLLPSSPSGLSSLSLHFRSSDSDPYYACPWQHFPGNHRDSSLMLCVWTSEAWWFLWWRWIHSGIFLFSLRVIFTEIGPIVVSCLSFMRSHGRPLICHPSLRSQALSFLPFFFYPCGLDLSNKS